MYMYVYMCISACVYAWHGTAKQRHGKNCTAQHDTERQQTTRHGRNYTSRDEMRRGERRRDETTREELHSTARHETAQYGTNDSKKTDSKLVHGTGKKRHAAGGNGTARERSTRHSTTNGTAREETAQHAKKLHSMTRLSIQTSLQTHGRQLKKQRQTSKTTKRWAVRDAAS